MPPFILSNGDESLCNPRAIKRRLISNAREITGVYGLSEMLDSNSDRASTMAHIESAVLTYLANSKAVTGL